MIDLLVCNYGTRAKLERLVNTLWDSTPNAKTRNWRLYLTDNDSPDDSREWIENNKHKFDAIWLSENVGYAKAINNMVANTISPVFAACNADIWFTNQDIDAIDTVFNTRPTVAILGPKQRDEDGKITHAGIFGSLTAPKHRGWLEHDPADIKYGDMSKALTISGSAYFVRRQVSDFLMKCHIYKDIMPNAKGPFLETKHYWEETAVSYHLHAHRNDKPYGYPMELWYWGPVSIGHSWHAASAVGSSVVDEPANIQESKALFVRFCNAHRLPHD